MKQYLDLVRQVLEHGQEQVDRTGVGTLSLFGLQAVYDLGDGFPILTTKKVNFSAVVKELLWFLRGETNVKTLGCGIWDAWAGPTGEVGPVYAAMWRDWGAATFTSKDGGRWRYWGARGVCPVDAEGVDQIATLVKGLKENPAGRRHIVTAWDPRVLEHVGLPPCHCFFQCYVRGKYLDLQLYQRSADLALGVPFNIASYALLLTLIATEVGLTPGRFIHTFGDVHVYKNHVDGLKIQLEREPQALPTLHWDAAVGSAGVPSSREACARLLTPESFQLVGYNPRPAIKFEVAV